MLSHFSVKCVDVKLDKSITLKAKLYFINNSSQQQIIFAKELNLSRDVNDLSDKLNRFDSESIYCASDVKRNAIAVSAKQNGQLSNTFS